MYDYIIIIYIQFTAKTFTKFIPNLNNNNTQINELNQNNKVLENKLNEEIIKNNNLKEENKKLLKENMKLKEELNKNNKLKIDLDNYIKENKKLKDELLKTNKNISKFGNNNTNNNEILNLNYQLSQKDIEIRDLKYQLLEKNNEIKDLKSKSQSNSKQNKEKFDIDEIMIVYFKTQDQEINHVAIRCLPSDTFAEVEEKIYKKFGNYRNTNNTPICNGRIVLRFKTLRENKIKDENVVQLIKME